MTGLANGLHLEHKGTESKGGNQGRLLGLEPGQAGRGGALHRQGMSGGRLRWRTGWDISRGNRWIAASRLMYVGSERRTGLEIHT